MVSPRNQPWVDSSSPSRSTTPIGERGYRTAAGVIACGRVVYAFDGLNRLLAPLFSRPEDRLEVFLRLPLDMQEAAWDAVPTETEMAAWGLESKEAITDTSTRRTTP